MPLRPSMSGCGIGSGNPGLTRISKDELAGLDRPALARKRVDAAALDRRLVDAVLVAERIEVARLRAEVLSLQNADTREAFILLASDGEGAAPLFLGIAECAHADVNLTCAERELPVFRIVDALRRQAAGRAPPSLRGTPRGSFAATAEEARALQDPHS